MNNQPQKQKSSKMAYLVLFVIVAGALLYYFYTTGISTPESLTMQEESLANQAAGMRVLTLLNEINVLKIDNVFFADQSYRTLRDYTNEIPTLPVGRSNPFAPVPGMVTNTQPSSTGR
jgi:hypothetical protein